MSNPNIQNLLEQAIRAGDLALAKQALEAGATTDAFTLSDGYHPPALLTAIFFNPCNRLRGGVTREWCQWMGIDPDEYAKKPFCKVVETPKAGDGGSGIIETYPDLPMVQLLLQHGADPDWSIRGIMTMVLNHEFLNDHRYREYQETLEALVDRLLPSARKLNLNDLNWNAPRMHPSLLEKVWNHVVLHQIEQPALVKAALDRVLQQSENPQETMRQLITLKGLRWEHFRNLPKHTGVLPSIRTLEFAMEHIIEPEVNEQQWSIALGKQLTVACRQKYWLHAGDLIRLGAIPVLEELDLETLRKLVDIYPKEYLNRPGPSGHTLLSAIHKGCSRGIRDDLIPRLIERGAEPISKILDLDLICERKRDFRYILVLAQLVNLDPAKVNWTANGAQSNPLYLFKRLSKDLQQQVIKVGFMAPSLNKATPKFQAPSREHAGTTFLKLKDQLPAIEENIRVQRRAKALIVHLHQRHKNLIDNSIPIAYRSRFMSRTRTGFFTLFHAARASALREALNHAQSLDERLQMLNHQLSFYPGEKKLTRHPFGFWPDQAFNKHQLTKKFKRYPIKSRIGYYGLLQAMKQETEAAIRCSMKDGELLKIQHAITHGPLNKRGLF